MINNVHILEVDIVLTCILLRNVTKKAPVANNKAI